MEKEGEIIRVQKEVDARHISALVAQSDKALYFENVAGFRMPVLSGLINTRHRLALSMNVPDKEMAKKFQAAVDRPIPSKVVSRAPVQEVVYRDEEVDLTMLVNHLYLTFDPLPCHAEGNMTGDAACLVDIADLTAIVNHLYITFEPLADCMPECE